MREPDLSKLAKTLTSKRLECSDEIKLLMDCMAVSSNSSSLLCGAVHGGS